MKPLFRFLAACACLLALLAVAIWHLGGQQMDFVAETTIRATSVAEVMEHLEKPELVEQWAWKLNDLEQADPSDTAIGAKATSRFEDAQGLVEVEHQFLYATDHSLTVRSSNEHFDVRSIWQVEQRDSDVFVRQLLAGTHKGLGRLTALFNKRQQQETMERDLSRLKSLIETGEVSD